MSLQFDSFNQLMEFIAITRRLSGYADCIATPPKDCKDPSLYKDIYSLLYLYYPERLSEAITVYGYCVNKSDHYESWVKQQFGLNVSFCRNVRIVNELSEVEELITQDHTIVSSDMYLKPNYIEVREIPPSVQDVVKEFKSMIERDIYVRLVQVCQFSYPSPLPLVRAILDLYSEEWANLFDSNPYAFLKAIRESNEYCEESFTNRSYRKPRLPTQRLDNVFPVKK